MRVTAVAISTPGQVRGCSVGSLVAVVMVAEVAVVAAAAVAVAVGVVSDHLRVPQPAALLSILPPGSWSEAEWTRSVTANRSCAQLIPHRRRRRRLPVPTGTSSGIAGTRKAQCVRVALQERARIRSTHRLAIAAMQRTKPAAVLARNTKLVAACYPSPGRLRLTAVGGHPGIQRLLLSRGLEAMRTSAST